MFVFLFEDVEMVPLSAYTDASWNRLNAVPMYQWLSCDQPDNAAERLKALGNVVVPRQAALGSAILRRMNAQFFQ